jgi:putative flippase GtrA
VSTLQNVAREGVRYFGAAAIALAADFGVYTALIRLASVNYLVAAPIGFSIGLAIVYALSVRWVFRQRRVASRRAEFLIFTLIGLAGMALNQAIIYVAVHLLPGAYEVAKAISAATVFWFNFGARKVLLFTRYR